MVMKAFCCTEGCQFSPVCYEIRTWQILGFRLESGSRNWKPSRIPQPRWETLLGFLIAWPGMAERFSAGGANSVKRSMAVLAISLGLRASEVLGSRCKHVDWLNQRLCVEQRIYRQQVDTTKTSGSSAELHLDASVLRLLKEWRHASQFNEDEDWMFASPVQLGRLPISCPWFWRSFRDAAIEAGVGPLGTHTLRHTYRSWIDLVGTPVAAQQKLMRHSDIRTTMNVYGDDERLR